MSLVLRPLGTEKTIIIIVPILAIEEPKVHRRKDFTGRTETNLEFTKPMPNPVYLGAKVKQVYPFVGLPKPNVLVTQ